MSDTLTLTVKGEVLLFKEPTLKEWNMCLMLSKTDEQAANIEFVKSCCISHDGQQLQAIFEMKPLAITRAFSMLYRAMQEDIDEGKGSLTA